MPVPTSARIDVRILFHSVDQVLAARRPGVFGSFLPGGPVAPGEGVERALDRLLADWTGREMSAREFVGCVENGGGNAPHDLTLVFAAGWPSDGVTGPHDEPDVTVEPLGHDDLTALEPAYIVPAVRRWIDHEWPFWRGMPVQQPDPRWTQLWQSVQSLRAQLTARGADLRSAAFRDASVAMCALVAAADGRIDPREREQMRVSVTTDDVLATFPTDDLERLFDMHVDRLRADFETGKAAALHDVAKVRGRPVEARAVVQLGAVIGRADGVYDDLERAAVLEAVVVLGLDPSALAVQSVAL